MKALQIIIDTKTCAKAHMQEDFDLVEGGAFIPDGPTLRFYSWAQNGAITLGRFLARDALVCEDVCQERGVDIALRPTGGGLLLHTPSDISFTLFLPSYHPAISKNPKDNYSSIHKYIYRAFEKISSKRIEHEVVESTITSERPIYCMASYTPYDIVLNGRKIGGSACRITKKGLLFQASIFIEPSPWSHFKPCLQNGDEAIFAMQATSSSMYDILDGVLLPRDAYIQAIAHGLSEIS